ncbi:MAG: amino acid permease [Armatimonadetes bacterium]|nr:amino acid permease [Armatimonadota bacterium]
MNLARSLSLTDATMLIVGLIIGSGIFFVTPDILQAVGSPGMVMAVWLVSGVLSLFGALTYAELGASRPEAGGQYVFLRDAYGTLCAFLYGWVAFWVIQSGSVAAVAVAFARSMEAFVPLPGHLGKIAAVACVLFLTVVNALSVRYGAGVQNLFTVLKCLVIGVLVLIGISQGAHLERVFISGGEAGPSISSFGVGMIAALWAYDGWNNGSFIAGEIRDPQRNVPRALFVGTGLVVLIYLLTNAAYLAVLTPTEVLASKSVGADAAIRLLGERGALLISLGIMVSTFGCVNGLIMAGPRVYYAMARDGLFFRGLGKVHAGTGTPVASILASGAWSSLLVLQGSYEQLFTYVMFASWVFYGLTGFSIFIFRRREAERPYSTWGYPAVPLLFVAASAFLVVNTLLERPWESLYGVVLALAGIPFYVFWRSRLRA